MPHYRSNLRDLEFNLFEVFGAAERMGTGPYADMDPQTAREVLREVDRLATGPLAEPFADADRNPPVYDPVAKTVTMPEGFKQAFRALMDAEWWRLDLPERLGGTGAPPSLRWAASELLLGSQPAAFMFMSGPGFASILENLGNEAMGRHDGAHRARRGVGRRRWSHARDRQRRRHLADRGRQALHHVR